MLPPTVGFAPLSDAMVNIRATLDKALSEGIISSETHQILVNSAKRSFYQDRTIRALVDNAEKLGAPLSESESLRRWLDKSGIVDQKKLDTAAALEEIRVRHAGASSRKQVAYHFEHTCYWDHMRRDSESRSSSVDDSNAMTQSAILDEVRLSGQWSNFTQGALLRHFSVREARQQGFESTDDQIEQAALGLRKRLGLLEPEQLRAWLADQQLTRDEFLKLAADQAAVDYVRQLFAGDMVSALTDHLRVSGEYDRFAKLAQSKAECLGDGQLKTRGIESTGMTESELLSWYFTSCLGRSVPTSNELGSEELGFEDVRSMRRAIIRAWHFHQQNGASAAYDNRLSQSQDRKTPLAIGDPVPNFRLQTQQGEAVRSRLIAATRNPRDIRGDLQRTLWRHSQPGG